MCLDLFLKRYATVYAIFENHKADHKLVQHCNN